MNCFLVESAAAAPLVGHPLGADRPPHKPYNYTETREPDKNLLKQYLGRKYHKKFKEFKKAAKQNYSFVLVFVFKVYNPLVGKFL